MKRIDKRYGRLLAALMATLLALVLAACQVSTPTPAAGGPPTLAPTDPAAAAAPVGAATADAAEPTIPATPIPIVLEGATTTESGLQYLEITKGKGEAPKKGDIITMQYVASLPDGSELANTYTANKPITTVWGPDNLLPGWSEGVSMMNVGGKAKLAIPPELAFGEQGNGSIPPNTQIIIEMELLAVEEAPVPTRVADDKLTKSETGLQYYDIKVGDGAEAVEKNTVSTNYVIWVKTAEGHDYIDRSGENPPVQFVLGRGDTVFPGWEEGVTGMKVGGKRLLVIPPDLGMGAQGNSLIPANSTLVMEIELTDVVEPRTATKVDEKDFTTTDSGLKYYDLKPGTGETPVAGQTVVVHYTGWLEDGTQFDSSVESGTPFTFQLGTGGVIPGWDEGLSTMKVGGKRQLVIPAELGYGAQGSGIIPPGATLIFEVELLEIQQ